MGISVTGEEGLAAAILNVAVWHAFPLVGERKVGPRCQKQVEMERMSGCVGPPRLRQIKTTLWGRAQPHADNHHRTAPWFGGIT